jgi:hypothetical protein
VEAVLFSETFELFYQTSELQTSQVQILCPSFHYFNYCIYVMETVLAQWVKRQAARPGFIPGNYPPIATGMGGWVKYRTGLDNIGKRKVLPLLGIEPGTSGP